MDWEQGEESPNLEDRRQLGPRTIAVGGLGTLLGALWGALVIVLVPTYVTDVATSHGLSGGVAANVPIAAYGVVLIVVMLIFPQGIQGGLRRLARQFLPTHPPHPGSPGRRPPVSEDVGPDSPYRRPPVSEHQEEGTS